MAWKSSGREQSSLITHTQLACVWALIDSTWRANRPSGGLYVARQMATSGPSAAGNSTSIGSGRSATGIRPSGSVASGPVAKLARSASSTCPDGGASRITASPQKPLR